MTVFDGFPFLEGKYLNYAQYFALLIMIFLLIISLIFALLWIFMKWLRDFFRRRDIINSMKSGEMDDNPMLNEASSEVLMKAISTNRLKNELDYNKNDEKEMNMMINREIETSDMFCLDNKRSLRVKITSWMAYVFSLLSLIFLSFTPLGWSSLNLMSLAGSIFIMLILYYIRFFIDVYDFSPQAKKNFKGNSSENIIKRKLKNFMRINILAFRNMKCFYITANVLILFFSIFIPFFFENTCISLFNPPIGFYFADYIDISTKMTRSISENYKCPSGPPCHIYATLPENATTGVFINFHTNIEHNDAVVLWDDLPFYDHFATLKYTSHPKKFRPQLEAKGERNVYSALIDNMTANSSYAIGIYYDGKIQALKIYKTMPGAIGDNDSLILISGGDVSSTNEAKTITKNLIGFKPSAIFIGGDVAYDDGLTSCYHTWDNFLNMMEDLSTTLNYLTPLILGVGNHDVGLNNLAEVELKFDSNTPLYLQFFPQHFRTSVNGTMLPEVPEINERKTYFYHDFGNILYLSLDSGYLFDFKGEQLVWMNQTMTTFNDRIKFAQYHVPTYSSCVNKDADKTHNMDTLLYWNPMFDQFRMMTVFENHVHLFKRTLKLKGNLYDEKGTLYLGDGLWGVQANQCDEERMEERIFVKISKDIHVWVTNITKTKVEHMALGLNGSIFDRDWQNVTDYVSA